MSLPDIGTAKPFPSLEIRAADISDAPAFTRILNAEIAQGTASWRTSLREPAEVADWIAARTADRWPLQVAVAGGEVGGFAALGPFRTGEGYARTAEHTVYVARSHRRRGLALALGRAAIAAAPARGIDRLVAAISADQPASLALHARLGFVSCGLLPGIGTKHGRRLDLALMVLSLPDTPAPEGC